MNAEQKKIALECIRLWGSEDLSDCSGDQMAALLQELVDAPAPEPVARVTGYYAGYLSIATVDGRVLPTGTALYTAPPAPSVPDGWMRAIDEAMVVHHIGIADRADSYEVAKKKLNALLAINSDIARDCSEAPADLVRDAEPWKLLLENLVEGLNKTHWSSWQGTAHFDEYLQEAISAIERDKQKGGEA